MGLPGPNVQVGTGMLNGWAGVVANSGVRVSGTPRYGEVKKCNEMAGRSGNWWEGSVQGEESKSPGSAPHPGPTALSW